MLHAFKVRIYPNIEQQMLFESTFNATRYVWNWALRKRMNYYKGTGRSLNLKDLDAELTFLKSQESMAWLRSATSQSLQSVLKNLDKAYKAFFDPANPAKFPKFKKKNKSKKSFALPQFNTVDLDLGLLSILKAKNIKAVFSRSALMAKLLRTGKVKTVTISMTSTGKYFASILIDDGMDENKVVPSTIEADKTLGIDVGIGHLLVLSDGTKIDNPRHTSKYQNKLAIEQRKLARKKQGSNNRLRQKRIVALVYEKIKNSRTDNLHKQSTKLVCKNHATSFMLETLKVKNMVQNHKLAKHIADCGWYQFLTMLQYKAIRMGKNVIKIGQFFSSSKICSCCGHKLDELKLDVRDWICPKCNTHHDRDVNAAINIKQEGLKVSVDLSNNRST